MGAPGRSQAPIPSRGDGQRQGGDAFVSGSGLVYLMGPSGSGKDTLLGLVRASLSGQDRIAVARRVITRPSGVDEPSLEVTEAQFERMSRAGDFAMQWSSHGLRYGIGVDIDERLAQGTVVIVNGSRRYLPRALSRYPGMSVVEIHVDGSVLAQRLAARGRESAEQISQRLAQAVLDDAPHVPPPGVLHRLANNAAPDVAAQGLLDIARGLLAR